MASTVSVRIPSAAMPRGARYELMRLIASGPVAEVWRARPLDPPGEPVALKRLMPHPDRDGTFRAMFFDEVRIAAALDHPAIARVLDWGLTEGTEFIAFELVDGLDAARALSLGRRIERPMPVAAGLVVVSRIAEALDHAHRAVDAAGRSLGIVHRDVTPSNVLLGWNGEVKLADFGIAYAVDRLHETASGVVKGKAGYVAPEQAAGGDVSPATDVYALGATLHALTTGAAPLRDWSEMASRFLGGPLPIAPDLDPRIASLVSACMSLEPPSRPTVAAVAASVTRLTPRDADRALVDWLNGLHPEATRRGPLDDLMDVALADASSGPREITITRPRSLETDD
jgi:serine/threonine-protein kinase